MIPSMQTRKFLRKNWLMVGVLGVACAALLWFAGNMAMHFMRFHDPRDLDITLKGWMTPRYIVMTYDLPRPLVAEALGLTSPDQRMMPMRDIADARGLGLAELTELVRDAANSTRRGGK